MTALKSTSAHKNTGIEARCAATGMRMTQQRRVIARVLAEAVDHPDVEELYRRCVAVDDKISISTVYRTVKLHSRSTSRRSGHLAATGNWQSLFRESKTICNIPRSPRSTWNREKR